MFSIRLKLLLAASITALSLGMTHESMAQALEEIIVTAERRETSLQDTPISIQAFTAEGLEFRGIETMEDVASFTPNLDIKGSRGDGNVSPTYQIRGLRDLHTPAGMRFTAWTKSGTRAAFHLPFRLADVPKLPEQGLKK